VIIWFHGIMEEIAMGSTIVKVAMNMSPTSDTLSNVHGQLSCGSETRQMS
jgi:hypothetical protein